jgi:hypothetical protein
MRVSVAKKRLIAKWELELLEQDPDEDADYIESLNKAIEKARLAKNEQDLLSAASEVCIESGSRGEEEAYQILWDACVEIKE